MPSPILFFIFIIVIDLILKSSRDRKKIRESKPSRPPTTSMPGPMEDLRKILDRELQREREKQVNGDQTKTLKPKEYKAKVETQKKELLEQRTPYVERKREPSPANKMASRRKEVKSIYDNDKESDIRRNLLMGIVFSEILSEPKSVQNQRRGL